MKTKHIAMILLLGASMSSCSDFLTEEPKGRLTRDISLYSQESVDANISALFNEAVSSQAWTNMQIIEWQGDDLTSNPGSNKQAYAEADRFTIPNTNKGTNAAWEQFYEVVKVANFIINNIHTSTISNEEKHIAEGQAKFWRAYAYFTLVRYYGDIPLVLDENNDNYTMTKSTVAQVYEQIIQDLKDCEDLPSDYNTAPRKMYGVNSYITQQAVKSTMAAVYMAMAGYPLNKTENYALAAAKAKEVIDGVNSGKYEYKLDDDYKNVYAMSNNYNLETVVGLNTHPIVGSWRNDASQLTSCHLFESLGGWGDGWGEYKFWKEFPAGARKDATYVPKIRLNDGSLVNFWDTKDGKAVVPEQHPMFCLFTINANEKGENIDAPFDYTKAPSTNMTNGHRHRLIRYSEVLLWYAEAKARTGTADDLALDCLRKVRARAGNTEVVPTNPQELAEAAYREHGWEVAGYWVALVTRRDDLLRMNRLKDVFTQRVANVGTEVAPGVVLKEMEYFNKTWNDNMNYMPIPASDASKNKNL